MNDVDQLLKRLFEADAECNLELAKILTKMDEHLKQALSVQSEMPHDQRKAALYSLFGVVDFLSSMGFDDRHLGSLLKLVQVLEDIDRGVVDLMLKPPAKGQGRQGTGEWVAKAYIAVALEARIRCGTPKETAARQIARELKNIERLRRKRGSHMHVAIIGWRDIFSENKLLPPGPHRSIYRDIMQMLNNGHSCEKVAAVALKSAREELRYISISD